MSKLFSLNIKDFVKGLIVSIFSATITGLITGLQSGSVDWKAMGTAAGVAGLGYLGKNFLSNSDGEPFSPENKNLYQGQ